MTNILFKGINYQRWFCELFGGCGTRKAVLNVYRKLLSEKGCEYIKSLCQNTQRDRDELLKSWIESDDHWIGTVTTASYEDFLSTRTSTKS